MKVIVASLLFFSLLVTGALMVTQGHQPTLSPTPAEADGGGY